MQKELGFDAVLLSPGGLASYSEAGCTSRTREVAAVLPVVVSVTALGRRTRLYLSVLGVALRDTKRYCNQKCAL